MPVQQITNGHIRCGYSTCRASITIATTVDAPWLHARHTANEHGWACSPHGDYCPTHARHNPIKEEYT